MRSIPSEGMRPSARVREQARDVPALGLQALYSNTAGGGNTASGANAQYWNTTGNDNTATGAQALLSNTTGFHNTVTGVSALLGNTRGEENVATGHQALYRLRLPWLVRGGLARNRALSAPARKDQALGGPSWRPGRRRPCRGVHLETKSKIEGNHISPSRVPA